MKIIGTLIALAGWLIAVAGLFMSSSNMGRGCIAILGIAVTFFGVFGVINAAFLKTANWKQ